MTSRVRSPPPSPYRLVPVESGEAASEKAPISDRTKVLLLLSGIALLVLIIVTTWPISFADLTGERVFQGEVWGDLTAEGEIWGECQSDLERVWLGHWTQGGGTGLRANVTNVSRVWLESNRLGTNISVNCSKGSFVVIADNGSFGAYLSDLDIRCEYQEFSGTFPGEGEDYYPDCIVSTVEGQGTLVHGEDHRWDISMRDCVVIVDGVEYHDVDSLFIPDDEAPLVEIRGAVGQIGNLDVSSVLHPHVRGTLEVEDFYHETGGRTRHYKLIRFEGEDISIKHSGNSRSGTGGPFEWFDQWSIDVTISDDATVEVEPALPTWVEAALIALVAILSLVLMRTVRRMRARAEASDQGHVGSV